MRLASLCLLSLLSVLLVASGALPEGYCVGDFDDQASAVAGGPTPSTRSDNVFLTAARKGELTDQNQARAYLERRLRPASVFLVLFVLSFFATCPTCTSRLCCTKRCCKPDASKGEPPRTKRILHAGVWGGVACFSMAFVAVGIHYTRGVSQAVSLVACEAVQLAADVDELVDALNSELDAFNDIADVIEETSDLLGGRSDLVVAFDAVIDDMRTFENTVSQVNISGAEWEDQSEIESDMASARASLEAGRPTIVELNEVLSEASAALIGGADDVKDVSASVTNLDITIPFSERNVEDFVVNEVIPLQERVYGAAVSWFVYALCALLVGTASVVHFVLKPARRPAPIALNCAFSCEWLVVLASLLIGGLVMIVPPILADVCFVVSDFPDNIREYEAVSSAGRGLDVLEGCFKDPPVNIASSLDLIDGSTDFEAQISFDALDDIDLGSALNYDDFHAARDLVNGLTWRDFGLNTTRLELIDECCDAEAVCCGAPESCSDADLESCSFAPVALELNQTVNSEIDNLQSDMAALDTSVTEFDAAAEGALDALRSVKDLTEPVRDAISGLSDLGECGFLAERYWGTYHALCQVGLPSIFWMAMGLCMSGALGIVLASLLLVMAKMALVAVLASSDRTAPHTPSDDKGASAVVQSL